MKNSENIARRLWPGSRNLYDACSGERSRNCAGEAIRNNGDPICSDSINLDSDLQPSRDRLPILLPHVRLIKDLRAPQGLDGREAEPWHRDSITISRRPFIRSNASARRPRLQ